MTTNPTPDKGLSLSELARHCGRGPNSLCRTLARYPDREIEGLRIERNGKNIRRVWILGTGAEFYLWLCRRAFVGGKRAGGQFIPTP